MRPSDETLMAYADGEVDENTRQIVESAMRDDPEVALRVQRHRELRTLLTGAFAAVVQEPIPERLLSAARPSRRPRADHVVRRVQPYALAASLLLGVALGFGLWHDTASLLVRGAGGGWVAHGPLARALSEQLSSQRSVDEVATIALSYRTKAGGFCRTFQLNRDNSSGVACRASDSWKIEVLAANAPPADASPTYRTAGSTLSPSIRATIEEQMQGDALDAAGEMAARTAGWKGTITP